MIHTDWIMHLHFLVYKPAWTHEDSQFSPQMVLVVLGLLSTYVMDFCVLSVIWVHGSFVLCVCRLSSWLFCVVSVWVHGSFVLCLLSEFMAHLCCVCLSSWLFCVVSVVWVHGCFVLCLSSEFMALFLWFLICGLVQVLFLSLKVDS